MTRPSSIDVLVAVTGSIAAYKSVEVVRQLLKQGLQVEVMMTAGAQRFVGSATFSGLTQRSVASDAFSAPGELHVELASRSKRLLVVPATADLLARLAQGRADDLVTATSLCFTGDRFVAPAMHPSMWSHPATQRNVATLRNDGVRFIGPISGTVASGAVGTGRMAEPVQIAWELIKSARQLTHSDQQSTSSTSKDLIGRRVIVTAGPTVEDIDPVRFLSNRSSGKMGFAIAERAACRGAEVQLVAGPVELPTPAGVQRHDIRSAVQMLTTLRRLLETPCDALFMAAAVGDYRAAQISDQKLKRGGDSSLTLAENPDVIATLSGELRQAGAGPQRPLLVAFALETGDEHEALAHAQGKRLRKNVDFVVTNLAHEALGTDDNRVIVVGEEVWPAWSPLPKRDVADRLLTELVGPRRDE